MWDAPRRLQMRRAFYEWPSRAGGGGGEEEEEEVRSRWKSREEGEERQVDEKGRRKKMLFVGPFGLSF